MRLEHALGYVFKNKQNLEKACHAKSTRHQKKNQDFERLEFLGDRVLGLAIADILCEKYGNESEGDLAKRFAVLVSKESCVKIAEKINLHTYITDRDGKKVAITAHSNILSDAMEALLGAIYCDSDFETVKKIITSLWQSLLEGDLRPPRDAKTILQEYAQSFYKCVPVYTLLETKGPHHAPHFIMKVFVEGLGESVGEGLTKRQAEQAAADYLLKDKQIL